MRDVVRRGVVDRVGERAAVGGDVEADAFGERPEVGAEPAAALLGGAREREQRVGAIALALRDPSELGNAEGEGEGVGDELAGARLDVAAVGAALAGRRDRRAPNRRTGFRLLEHHREAVAVLRELAEAAPAAAEPHAAGVDDGQRRERREAEAAHQRAVGDQRRGLRHVSRTLADARSGSDRAAPANRLVGEEVAALVLDVAVVTAHPMPAHGVLAGFGLERLPRGRRSSPAVSPAVRQPLRFHLASQLSMPFFKYCESV